MSGNGTALATVERTQDGSAIAPAGAIKIESIGEVFRLAAALAEARGFVPKALAGDPGGIAAAILTGIELGIGPMESMRVIHMVEGRPTMAADFILGRAIKAGIAHVWERSDDGAAILRLSRGGRSYRQTWTIEEANRAGLTKKDNWRNYPAAMLRARAIAHAMRAFAPDVLGAGVYLRDEIEGEDASDVESASFAAPVAALPQPSPLASLPMTAPPAPPLRLSEVSSDVELEHWCRENAAALASQTIERRDAARLRVREAAERCGVEEAKALEWAGLDTE